MDEKMNKEWIWVVIWVFLYKAFYFWLISFLVYLGYLRQSQPWWLPTLRDLSVAIPIGILFILVTFGVLLPYLDWRDKIQSLHRKVSEK